MDQLGSCFKNSIRIGMHQPIHESCHSEERQATKNLALAVESTQRFTARSLRKAQGRLFASLLSAGYHREAQVALWRSEKKRFAVNDEEYHLRRRAVAVPVFDNTGNVMSTLSVDGATSEIPIQRIPQLAQELIEMAEDVSRQIDPH